MADWADLPLSGPYAIGLFDPRSWGGGSTATSNAVTLEVTRVVLAVGVFAIGVELPKQYMLKHWKSLFFLLGPCMVYGWFAAAGMVPFHRVSLGLAS